MEAVGEPDGLAAPTASGRSMDERPAKEDRMNVHERPPRAQSHGGTRRSEGPSPPRYEMRWSGPGFAAEALRPSFTRISASFPELRSVTMSAFTAL